MLPIVWRATARDDLLQIIRYIANEDPKSLFKVSRARAMQGLGGPAKTGEDAEFTSCK